MNEPKTVMSNEEEVDEKPNEIQQIKDEKDHMPEEADFELIGEFITEGNDLIVNAEEALLTLETDPADVDAVDKVFRAFHTIKGTAAFMELDLVSNLGHYAETLLSRVRDGEIQYAGGYADLALQSLDMIKDLMGSVEKALGGDPLIKPSDYDSLIHILKNPEKSGISEEMDDSVLPEVKDILTAVGKVNEEDMAEAESMRIGDILVAQGKITKDEIESAVKEFENEPVGMAVIKSKAVAVEDVGQALRVQKMKRDKNQSIESSIRVSTDRLDRLIDSVGELVIAHSMVAQDKMTLESDNHEFQKKVAQTNKIVRELQDMSMSLRMVPLRAMFHKMSRLVRDLSKKVGKQIDFVIEGEETEIDRNMVDAVKDPLVHMIRNAVDHGIESPDVRKQAGKPAQGKIRLSAFHSGGCVIVEVKDDGKGLNREMIINKARDKGIITDKTTADRDILNLIFEPGFSTAGQVTDISGRGVGMDVVKKNIEAIQGQVDIQSEPGKGSTFQMKLPLTLAIIDGMLIRAGTETFVIPTISIVTSLKPEQEELSTVLNQGEMLSIQGKVIPLFKVTSLFDMAGENENDQESLVVVIEDEGSQVGLVIDMLLGRQQVVVKSLGETMRDIPGISGGAIMPDGLIGLILDPGGLIRLATM